MTAQRSLCLLVLVGVTAFAGASAGQGCFESAPVRPQWGDYVPPPFSPLRVEGNTVRCLGRSYDLSAAVPMPTVGERALLRSGTIVLNGRSLSASPLSWSLTTPAVAVAERSCEAAEFRVAVRYTVEYDGFITSDVTLSPLGAEAAIHDLALRLDYRPDASVLYDIPIFRPTWAGFWPKEMKIDKPIVGVWGGDDHAGFASYVATFRDWHNPGDKVVLSKGLDNSGSVLCRIVTEPTALKAPVTYRFGFIATPVRPPEKRHLQVYAFSPSRGVEKLTTRCLIWGGLSDHYATFRTNRPEKDPQKIEMVREAKEKFKQVLAYTTYDHVEDGAVDVPQDWDLAGDKGRRISRSIGGGMADRKRVFLCPGSRDWVEWKMKDLELAVQRYGVDGFYIDTSYIIMSCMNATHGHGWVDAAGERQSDFVTWSMREIWRRSYEMLCKARGEGVIYAHHKSGCPPALAAFTTAFCDGEQYTGQSIRQLTLDAFRAENAGRNMGPLALFLNEYYRSAHFGLREKGEHHNPTESLMLSLPHDVLCTGYPGHHPTRELIALRDDLGLADAEWTPYYAPGAQWRAEGSSDVVISSYRTARGDTVLIVSNPTYEDVQMAIAGAEEHREGRTFVAIDIFSRLGRGSDYTPGYRWEEADPDAIAVGARSFGVYAFVRDPQGLPAFAAQKGFVTGHAAARRVPLPDGALLVSDFDDPDWNLVNDDGDLKLTEKEPVDTRRALRVEPKPRHNAAAMLHQYAEPQDWTGYGALTFWVRPDAAMPVKTLDVRLRNGDAYTKPMQLTSHKEDDLLPAGRWTELRYEFGDVPREHVGILRLYYYRDERAGCPFDIDEMILHRAAGQPAPAEAVKPEPKKQEQPKPPPRPTPAAAEENKPIPD